MRRKTKSKKIEDFAGVPIAKVVVKIRDMLFINQLEKRLGRRLTEMEIEREEFDGELELFFPDGTREFIVFPRLILPDELMTKPLC